MPHNTPPQPAKHPTVENATKTHTLLREQEFTIAQT